MKNRIKKKHFNWAVINEIYFYIKEQNNKGYFSVLIEDELYNKEYGYIFITEKEIKQVKKLLQKEGYIVKYKKFIPKSLGCSGWCFVFKEMFL